MIFVIFAMLELVCQVLAPLQPHRVWRQWRGGRRYRGDWGSKNWQGKITFNIWQRFKCCESELKIEFNFFSIQAGRSGPIGRTQGKHQDANRRTDQLNIKVSLKFNFLWIVQLWFKLSIFLMDTSPQFLEKDRPLLRRLQTGAVETPDNYSYHGLACIFPNCHSGCAWTWNVNKSRNLWNRQCVSLRIKVRLYIGYTRSVLWCL